MNLFAFLTAIFMAMLPLLPCGDKEDCKLDYSRYVSIVDIPHDASSSHGVETCTPFCSCNCCSISVIESQAFFTQSGIETYWRVKMIYKNERPFGSSSIIWQPPRFG